MSAVPPKPVGVYHLGATKPAVVVETYLDYCCPFSKKMFDVLYAEVMPELKAGGQVDWLLQNVPQPWHPQSAYMHEVALAVKMVDESKFFAASAAIFAAQAQFFDDKTADSTRNQIYDELVAVVSTVEGLDAAAVRRQVAVSGAGNAGSSVTQEVKWSVKYHRARSVHVTPTVFLNGLEAPDISSGWSRAEWTEKLTGVLA